FQTSRGKFSRRDHTFDPADSTLGLLAALLMRMSMRPKRANSSSRTFSTSANWVMSVASPMASTRYFFAIAVAATSGFARGRSSSTGHPPAAAMISACLVPSSPAPPVMIATRPVRSKSVCARLFILVTSSLSAIGLETRSGNEGGGIRTEEHRNAGDFLGRAKTRKGHAGVNHLHDLVLLFFEVAFPGSPGK